MKGPVVRGIVLGALVGAVLSTPGSIFIALDCGGIVGTSGPWTTQNILHAIGAGLKVWGGTGILCGALSGAIGGASGASLLQEGETATARRPRGALGGAIAGFLAGLLVAQIAIEVLQVLGMHVTDDILWQVFDWAYYPNTSMGLKMGAPVSGMAGGIAGWLFCLRRKTGR